MMAEDNDAHSDSYSGYGAGDGPLGSDKGSRSENGSDYFDDNADVGADETSHGTGSGNYRQRHLLIVDIIGCEQKWSKVNVSFLNVYFTKVLYEICLGENDVPLSYPK